VINTIIQAIVEPKYPRRYVGRHRRPWFWIGLSARGGRPEGD